MGIHILADYYGVAVGVDTCEFFRISELVATLFGMPVQANKATIGSNAFAHSSGIHVDGLLKDRRTYEVMSPELVGFPESRVVLTARTGQAGLLSKLQMLGLDISTSELDSIYERFLELADNKREVIDSELLTLVKK